MQIIIDNYILVVSIGFFIVFALIGYLVDMFRNTNKNNISNDNIINTNENIVEITSAPEPTKNIEENLNNVNTNSKDDLLSVYDNQK